MTASEYWASYLAATGQRQEDTAFSRELCFENTGAVGESQLALVLSGKKTAIFSAFEVFGINREPLPVRGEVYIVEDGKGEPHGIIELTDVQVLPFSQVSWEMAGREGEDENLSAWQDKQREYLQRL